DFAGSNHLAGIFEKREHVFPAAGEVLQLHDAARPASGSTGTAELEHEADDAFPISAKHRRELLQAALLGLQPQFERLDAVRRHHVAEVVQRDLDAVLAQLGERVAACLRPGEELLHRARILEAGDLDELSLELLAYDLGDADGLVDQFEIDRNTTLVDFLVEPPVVPLPRLDRILLEQGARLALNHNVLDVVLAELLPLGRAVEVVGPDPRLRLRRLARLAEILDECLAAAVFLELRAEFERLTY